MHRRRVRRRPRAVPVKQVALPVEAVAAALRHRVHNAARRAPVLRRVIRRVHLELLHRLLDRRVPGPRPAPLLREKCLVVVRPVDRHIVQQRALAPKRQQPVAARIVHHARRQQGKCRPAIVVLRQVVHRFLRNHAREIRRGRVYQRRRVRHPHLLLARSHLEPRLQRRQNPHLHRRVHRAVRCKARSRNRDVVRARIKMEHPKKPRPIRRQNLRGIGAVVADRDRGIRHSRLRAVQNSPPDRAVHGGLCVSGGKRGKRKRKDGGRPR